MASESSNPETRVSDRERWEVETAFRERELALKERELELKLREQASSGWRSPLVIAIMAATIAALGNAVVATVNGRLQRDLEDRKSEQVRILEMIKTGDPDKAAENLKFLLDAGLIRQSESTEQLATFLAERKPGTGPTLPAEGSLRGGITGNDEAVGVKTLPTENPLQRAAGAVGRLRFTAQTGGTYLCTAFLVGESLAMTAAFCALNAVSGELLLGEENAESVHPVELPAAAVSPESAGLNYALVRVGGAPGAKHGTLRLSARSPAPGEKLALLLFRDTGQKLVVAGAADCRVLKVEQKVFYHLCDSGSGSSGAPLLAADGSEVLGLHFRRSEQGNMAVRGDLLAAEVRRVQAVPQR